MVASTRPEGKPGLLATLSFLIAIHKQKILILLIHAKYVMQSNIFLLFLVCLINWVCISILFICNPKKNYGEIIHIFRRLTSFGFLLAIFILYSRINLLDLLLYFF